jgi:hypothetical protein
MDYEKKWDFEFPTGPVSTFKKIQASVSRASNNLKYGFDGLLTPLQLGPHPAMAKPLLDIEVKLTSLLNDGEITRFMFESFRAGRGILKEVKRKKKLAGL